MRKQQALILILPFLLLSTLMAAGSEDSSSDHPKFRGSQNMQVYRERIARKLNDIDRVELIMREYKKFIHSLTLSYQSRNNFEEWFYKKSIFIGSKYYDHSLVYEAVPELRNDAKFQKAYKLFIDAITPKYTMHPKAAHSKSQKHITILFTGFHGGGHKSPAVALAQYFEKTGHKVQLIDVDELENLYSPKVDGYTRAQIYSEVFQKEGNAEKASELWKKIDEAQKPETRKYMGDLKKIISVFKTDHIFAVAHHKPSLTYLSYQLGIPMTYVHTDHVFNKSLVQLLVEQAKLKKTLVNFAALTSDSAFFNKAYKALKIKGKNFPPAIMKQLIRLDFPVRASFSPVNRNEMKQIRDELHIPYHAIVCKLAMGQNGATEEIKSILIKLMKEDGNLKQPLHVFVVCGKNEILQKMLQKIVKDGLKKNSKITIDVRGFMEEQEMAKVDKACNVWITKPGGSTCAELVKTQKQMLYVLTPNHPWEKTNAAYLERMHLAQELSLNKPLIKQMEERIEAQGTVNPLRLTRSDWREQATRLINGDPQKLWLGPNAQKPTNTPAKKNNGKQNNVGLVSLTPVPQAK